MAPLSTSETGRDIRGPADVEAMRRLVVEQASELGFSRRVAQELALVVSELGTNILRYAGSGAITLRPVSDRTRAGLEVTATDYGPGIADVAAALRDGFSTGGGLGMGLGLIQRLSDELAIETGEWGTRITLMRWQS